MADSASLPADPTETAQPRRRTFEIETSAGPGVLAALEFGDPARPIDVVFLHANGFNAMTYRSVLAPLGDRLRILAVDQQGHGRSPQRESIEGRRNWLGFRDDLIALLDRLDGPPMVLAGHSMGGAASVLAAAERPERVKALALFDPVIVSREIAERAAQSDGLPFADSPLAVGAKRRRAVFQSRAEVFDRYRGRGAFTTWSDEALTDYIADGFRERPDGAVELTCAPEWEFSNFASHGHDSIGAMHRLRMPVTILRAEMGSTCSVASADAFIAENPRMRIETIPGTTHFLPIERPDLVRETLLAATTG